MAQPREERSYSTHSPDGKWDYIVIGSGMGGMTCAALLSELGKKVLVLEQHYVPGGFTHTFKRKKWVWDVGVHAVGEVDSRAVLGRLLERLTGGRLEWATLGPVYDEFHFPDLQLDFPDSREGFAANLRAAFPGERAAREIDEYLQKVRDVSSVMRRYYLSRLLPPAWAPLTDCAIAGAAHRLLGQTTRAVLDEISDDQRWKSVVTAQWGYYGVPPARSSFAIHALVARHFLHGGYYPKGGAERIARELLATVAAGGGWTRIRADVKEVLVEPSGSGVRAAGVRLESGEEIRAGRVISAAGALATLRLLPEAERRRPWAQSIATLSPSPCHVCLYLGFHGDIRPAGASPANKWFYETWSPDVVGWDALRPDARAPVLYCSFPSLKDPQHQPGPHQLHTGEVVTFVPWSTFTPWLGGRWQRRGDEYDRFKQSLTDRLLAQFLEHMPGLRDKVAHAELSTPLSTEHFTRATKGSIYGIEPTPSRYQNPNLRPRTSLPDFFLTGADMASVGVMGAMVGGVLTAVAAEPLRAAPYLYRALRR